MILDRDVVRRTHGINYPRRCPEENPHIGGNRLPCVERPPGIAAGGRVCPWAYGPALDIPFWYRGNVRRCSQPGHFLNRRLTTDVTTGIIPSSVGYAVVVGANSSHDGVFFITRPGPPATKIRRTSPTGHRRTNRWQ